MRLAGALALAAALALPLAAWAQAWKRFDYADSGFALQLPAAPQVSEGPYRTASGLTVPSKTWTLAQDDVVYTMTVADFSNTPMEKDAALEEAVKALAAGGEIKADVTERIDREYGRQVTVVAKDGARSTVSIFFVNHKLYRQEGRALPPDPGAGSGKAVRFQQSLEFIGLNEEAGRPENRFGGPGRFAGGGFRRGPPPPAAFDACRSKRAGDRVELVTPRGALVASCIETPQGLAARPDRPPVGEGPPPI